MKAIDWTGVYWQKGQENGSLHNDGATAAPHAKVLQSLSGHQLQEDHLLCVRPLA
jgi:hypothetical protein